MLLRELLDTLSSVLLDAEVRVKIEESYDRFRVRTLLRVKITEDGSVLLVIEE